MLHKAMQNKGARIAIAVFATLLYALGVNLFIVPVGLYSGGMVGLSQVIRTVLTERVALPAGVDIAGILYFLLNVPMLIIGWKELGRGFLVRTLICVGASSFFLSVIPAPASPILEERLAACVVGGILCGFALGLALTCGCSTGGLDIIGLCLSKRGSRFTVGRFSMSFNVLLYAACALLFNIQTAIYSVIYTVFCSLFIDRGHQQNISVQVLIFTKDEDPELPQNIMGRLGRGVTYWQGKGAYTGSDIRKRCASLIRRPSLSYRRACASAGILQEKFHKIFIGGALREQGAAFLQYAGHLLKSTMVSERFIKNWLHFLVKCDNIQSNLFALRHRGKPLPPDKDAFEPAAHGQFGRNIKRRYL